MQNDFLAISPSRSYGVMVSTLGFEPSDPSSNLGRTLMFWPGVILPQLSDATYTAMRELRESQGSSSGPNDYSPEMLP